MENSESAVVLLTGTIFIALIVERLMEIAMSLFCYLEVKHQWYEKWNFYAQTIQRRFQHIYDNKQEYRFHMQIALWRIRVDDKTYSGNDAISVKKIRDHVVRYVVKVLGVILGITIALLADIDIFSLIDQMLNPGETKSTAHFTRWSEETRQVLTGISMGFGAAPMHMIISSLEKANRSRKRTV